MKRKILTVKNKAVLYKKLKTYLEEILEEEEYFNSFEDLYKDAYRVKVYGRNRALTQALITEWLTGLPIGVEYVTYKICLMILEWLNLDKNCADKLGESSSIYLESQTDLDSFYWNTLGSIIYDEHFTEKVKCDRCGHILENYEYETDINIRCKENNIDRDVRLCMTCARQFNEHFMKNKIGYRKDNN